ncbi:RNA polymerase recycling motor HelD [Clostridium thermarum]|uniref:RNA polymerase recycling motor HelD n=1 Tax=Clostridium thermarum TaxID=1716543 RepID=UPI0013D426D1|nr:RNA polymerase recycling motor HelD [Clostridium thermarum]
MSIREEDFIYEKNVLKNTGQWLDKEIENKEKYYSRLESKVAELKKQSRGSYNHELETAINLQNISNKILNDYKEVRKQPYFARIDFEEARGTLDSFYIGKLGLMDEESGEEKVVDWRAPIADLYYSGTSGRISYEAPMGVIEGELLLKRKLLIRDGELINAFDEGIDQIILKSKDGGNEEGLTDEFLRINLEEAVKGKLKDIVATIQKEQNEIIRAEKSKAIIVQGSAGSGKTTVALHRLAYLLYKYRQRMKGSDVFVVAPNRLFLDYISDILPNLGVEDVKQSTFEEFALETLGIPYKIYSKDKKLADIIESSQDERAKYITNSSKIKGTMVYKTIIDRYAKYIEATGMDYEDIVVEGRTIFHGREVKRLYVKDLSHTPISKRKQEIKKYLVNRLEDRLSTISADIEAEYGRQIAAARNSMEDSSERRAILTNLYNERDNKKQGLREAAKEAINNYITNWQKDDIVKLYLMLFNDENIFQIITDDKIPQKLAKFMVDEINENFNNGRIDSDDLAAMLYLHFKINGIDEKYKFQHIVIDEAQDYSMFELYVLKQLAYNSSLTIVGDTGQCIYYYKGIDDWQRFIKDVYEDDIYYTPLTQSYRSTVEIVNFANNVLRKQKNSLEPAKPVLRHGKEPELVEYKDNKDLVEIIDRIVEEAEQAGKKNVTIICKTYQQCSELKKILRKSKQKWKLISDSDKKIDLDKIIIPSYMTKGLEFDCSIVFDCDSFNYGDTELDKRLLYVVLTRALHMEYILYKDGLSELLK